MNDTSVETPVKIDEHKNWLNELPLSPQGQFRRDFRTAVTNGHPADIDGLIEQLNQPPPQTAEALEYVNIARLLRDLADFELTDENPNIRRQAMNLWSRLTPDATCEELHFQTAVHFMKNDDDPEMRQFASLTILRYANDPKYKDHQ